MKVTVFGATGQIGSKVVELLTQAGYDVEAAARASGADVLTGDGLKEALAGSEVLVDVVNSPSFADDAVLDFFTTSSRNLIEAAKATGTGHYVALSIVNCDGLPESGYMRAKVAQEKAIVSSGLPYTIVRATQFHEFAEAITASLVVGDEVRVPDARIQLIAAAEVSGEVARAAQTAATNGLVNIGGPEKLSFAEMAQIVQDKQGENKPIVIDDKATYFGTLVDNNSLVTGDDGILAEVRFADWIAGR
ncbi:SDR family oxidoreductase [Mycobacterium sp. NPDC003449]